VPAGLFCDNDISASKGKHRPGYAALWAAIERGDLDGGFIVVYQTSRLLRNRRERAEAIDLFKPHRVSIVAYKGPDVDLTSSYGEFAFDIMGAADSWESAVKSERQSDTQRKVVQAGLHPGGQRPFGYNLVPDPARANHHDPAFRDRLIKPVVHKSEAKALRNAAAALLAGASLNSQVQALNEHHTTTWGKGWTAVSLVRTLTRPRNYGTVVYNGEEFSEPVSKDTAYTSGPFADDLKDAGPYKGTAWPAIWSEDTHRKLCSLFADPERATNRTGSNKLKSLLSHVAVCGLCGSYMKSGTKGRPNGTRRHIYKCSQGGEHVSRSKEACDHIVSEWLLRRLEQMGKDQLARLMNGPGDGGPFAEKARELRVKMDKLLKSFLEGTTPESLYKSHMTSLKAQLASAEKAMAAHSKAPVVSDLLMTRDIRGAWSALPLDRQRAVLRELVTVTVQPAEPGRTLKPGVKWTADNAKLEIMWHPDAAVTVAGWQPSPARSRPRRSSKDLERSSTCCEKTVKHNLDKIERGWF
jgi:DNA invertase Pin-like site-specific DNA recombinase